MTLQKLVEEIELRFKSGNDVPVTRATLKKEEWESLKQHLEMLAYELDGVLDDCHNPNGFDEVCEGTLRRVRGELIWKERPL